MLSAMASSFISVCVVAALMDFTSTYEQDMREVRKNQDKALFN